MFIIEPAPLTAWREPCLDEHDHYNIKYAYYRKCQCKCKIHEHTLDIGVMR